MNRLSRERRSQVLRTLVEGNSIRATCRITGAAKGTVLTLLADAGAACLGYQDTALRQLPCQRLQCDEIWSFCHAKEKNVPDEHKEEFGYGDVWTRTAIDPDTKLVPSFAVGTRDADAANAFMLDLASRLSTRVQLTTDGHKPYLEAVEGAFGADIDYAMLIKIYGQSPEAERRYSPAECIGADIRHINGNADPKHVSTSHVERQNLTMRMQMRHFTHPANAFSKKVGSLEHAVSLHFMHYNFCRMHQALQRRDLAYPTPAMAAGVADHVWSLDEIVRLIEDRERHDSN